jgi:uncharacterized protein (TIGR02722 family)
MRFIKMKKALLVFIFGVPGILLLGACASRPQVTRISPDTPTDLSGRWNDSDAQLVARTMIADITSTPWLNNFVSQYRRRPVLIVGRISNRSSEHIDEEVFIKSLERELINAGEVRLVASPDERTGIRDERLSQQSEASEETVKRLGQELGADFYLAGVITSIEDAVRGIRTMYFKVNLELIDIETNEKVWIGEQEIKKTIRISRYRA